MLMYNIGFTHPPRHLLQREYLERPSSPNASSYSSAATKFLQLVSASLANRNGTSRSPIHVIECPLAGGARIT